VEATAWQPAHEHGGNNAVVAGDDRTSDATEAVRELFVAHASDLHAYASRRVGRDLADDVVAETFRQAIESWERYDPQCGSARGWLFGIATNLLRRHWRTERRRLTALRRSGDALDRAATDPSTGIDDRLEADDRIARVLQSIANLDPEDRDLLVLVSWERMAHADVADVMSMPVGTVRSRLHRIRRRLEHESTADPRGDRT
jgi:RNA polymerase sigma-70 factor (ECF subfamily)